METINGFVRRIFHNGLKNLEYKIKENLAKTCQLETSQACPVLPARKGWRETKRACTRRVEQSTCRVEQSSRRVEKSTQSTRRVEQSTRRIPTIVHGLEEGLYWQSRAKYLQSTNYCTTISLYQYNITIIYNIIQIDKRPCTRRVLTVEKY